MMTPFWPLSDRSNPCLTSDPRLRAAEILKRFSEPRLMEESQQLSMFLATHNVLLMTVKDSVQRLASYEELLADVIAVSVRFFENRLYMTPAEKHGAVKVGRATPDPRACSESDIWGHTLFLSR